MKRFAALMIAGSMLALGGCASTSELAAVKADAERANAAAAKAQATADAATKRLNEIEATAAKALADEIISLCALAGMAAVPAGAYPGWSPNPASPLLQRCQAVFSREFAATSSVQVIHAGLECGLIGAVYPGMDIVSFGPTIRGAHAPGEAVEVASVARCWQLLTAILADLR